MTTLVVNKRKQDYDIYIGRGSLFGNPFVIGKDGDRDEVIRKYKVWFNVRIKEQPFKAAVLMLNDKKLGCYCKPLACHGDVIVEWLEKNIKPTLYTL